MATFHVHPEEARHEREREHECREDREIGNCHIGVEIEDAFHGVFHGIDIFFDDLDFRENLVDFVFEIFKVYLDFFGKPFFHACFDEAEYGNLRTHHMFEGNDVAFFDHDVPNHACFFAFREEFGFEILEVTIEAFKHFHRLVEITLDDIVEDICR